MIVVAAVVTWILAKLYFRHPEWKQYEGAIVSAIRHAEKTIPDDTPNKSMKKLDSALKFVIGVYALYNPDDPIPSMKTIKSIREGIQIVHAQQEEKK